MTEIVESSDKKWFAFDIGSFYQSLFWQMDVFYGFLSHVLSDGAREEYNNIIKSLKKQAERQAGNRDFSFSWSEYTRKNAAADVVEDREDAFQFFHILFHLAVNNLNTDRYSSLMMAKRKIILSASFPQAVAVPAEYAGVASEDTDAVADTQERLSEFFENKHAGNHSFANDSAEIDSAYLIGRSTSLCVTAESLLLPFEDAVAVLGQEPRQPNRESLLESLGYDIDWSDQLDRVDDPAATFEHSLIAIFKGSAAQLELSITPIKVNREGTAVGVPEEILYERQRFVTEALAIR